MRGRRRRRRRRQWRPRRPPIRQAWLAEELVQRGLRCLPIPQHDIALVRRRPRHPLVASVGRVDGVDAVAAIAIAEAHAFDAEPSHREERGEGVVAAAAARPPAPACSVVKVLQGVAAGVGRARAGRHDSTSAHPVAVSKAQVDDTDRRRRVRRDVRRGGRGGRLGHGIGSVVAAARVTLSGGPRIVPRHHSQQSHLLRDQLVPRERAVCVWCGA